MKCFWCLFRFCYKYTVIEEWLLKMSVYQPGHDISAKERTIDVLTRENVAFKDLLLSPVVLSGLQKARFDRPSPIQLKAIPYGRCGLDLIVQAKSGTGKTCVFTVIALEAISVEAPTLQVVILSPTREIAIQIEDVVKAIGQDIKGLKVAAFIGGRPVSEDKINAKGCHIAVGSPGRIFQLIELEILKCQSVRIFILDEADKLLEDNFQSQINSIYSMLPMNKQMIAASATYPNELAEFVMRYMRDPTFVRLNPKDMALLGVKQYCYVINDPPDKFYSVFERKIKAVVELLDLYPFQQSLIFSNYHSHAKDLSDACNSVGLPATYISGNLEQERRLEAMKMLKEFKCRVLISTDLTSRGIDASNVDLVVNLDVPMDWETFMHRTGRAGRFGSLGAVVSVVTSGNENNQLFEIAKTCAIQLYPLTCEAGKLDFGDIPVEFCDTSVGEEKQEYVKTRAKQEKKKPRQNGQIQNIAVPEQKIKAHSNEHNSSELHESPNSESTRTSESKNDPELPRIPSLPELMSKTRGYIQISFSYNDLMENFLYFKEHGIFKELKRIERPKSTTDSTKTTARYPVQDGMSHLNSARGGARKKTYNGNNDMGKVKIAPSFLTHKHLIEEEWMSLTDKHHNNGLQDHLAWGDFHRTWEQLGEEKPVTAQNGFFSQEVENPRRPPRNAQDPRHQTRRQPHSEHQIKALHQNSDKHVDRLKKEHNLVRKDCKKSVSDKAANSRTKDRRKSKNKTNNLDSDDDMASHSNMHPKFLLPKYSENFETEGHSEATSLYFNTMRQYQSAWQNYYYHCWWMQWNRGMSSLRNTWWR